MISRFFIDRPIFAVVLSIVTTLLGALGLMSLPIAQYPEITPPGVQVSIAYPGASVQVVADTVAATIEQQVNGVQGMLYMSSQSGNDGSYTLSVTFEVGTNLNTALVMVQNRVALAMPQLPTEVQLQGISIRKKTPDIVNVINFCSPDGRYDDIYLSNFATINVRDELLRVEGVSDINVLGQRDYSIRAWLSPQKLAACSITAPDVVRAIRAQNIEVVAGQLGQPPISGGQSQELPIDALGRLRTPEEFGDIVIKASQPPPPLAPTGAPTSPQGAAPGPIPTTNDLSITTMIGPPAPSSAPSGSSAGTGTSGTNTPTSASSSATSPSSSSPVLGSVLPGVSSSTPSGGATTGGGATIGGGATPAGTGSTGSSSTGVTPPTNLTGGGAATPSGLTSGGTSTGGTVGANALAGGSLQPAAAGGPPPSPAAAIVRLRDVARVEMGAQNYNNACTFDQRPSVGLAIHQLPDTNALDVGDRVRRKMEELQSRFPEGVAYEIAYDITPFVCESVMDVVWTLLEAVGLVAVVVLVFLQNWRAAIIPLVAVPVAIIGTFAVMALLGFSLNNISLFGLVLAIGIVVDDAIVGRGERRALAGAGATAARGGPQGHGRGDRPGHRHRVGALCGVRSLHLHRRHHRPVLPAVRGDHRRLDGVLRVQLTHLESGAGGPALAATRAGAGSADAHTGRRPGLVLSWLQQGVRGHRKRLHLDGRQVAPVKWHGVTGLWRPPGRDVLGDAARPHRLRPATRQGLSSPQCAAARVRRRGADGAHDGHD
jgi:multidrug efflux pump